MKVKSAGEACVVSAYECADATYCEPDEQNNSQITWGKCRARKADGADCELNHECESDRCSNEDKCEPMPMCGS